MDSKQPRFLITRLSHIGDCILTIPLACALRRQYPQAFIGWIVEKPTDQLLVRHSAIDHLIVVKRGWLKSPRRVWQVRREIRGLKFDVALDPHSLSKSALISWLACIPRRIGLAKPVGREAALWLNRELVIPQKQHVVDRSLELLGPLGIDDSRAEFNLPVQPAAAAMVESYLAAAKLTAGGYTVINPGAGWVSRIWPTERFGEVANYLGKQGVPVVAVWAGEEERSMAETIVNTSGGAAMLAPKTSLTELAELLRSAGMYIGSDTGPMHLAAAVGTPCVGLHGSTLPAVSGAYGKQHIRLQAYYQGSQGRKSAENTAMRAITVEKVCAACGSLLARGQRKSA